MIRDTVPEAAMKNKLGNFSRGRIQFFFPEVVFFSLQFTFARHSFVNIQRFYLLLRSEPSKLFSSLRYPISSGLRPLAG
jgi:hypothetical protein